MLIGAYNDLVNRGITDTPFRVIDHPFQRLFIVRIKGKPEIGYQILDLFTLIERQATVYFIGDTQLTQVYVVGLEENLFPSQMSLNSRSDLEEERRLFYVAVTRAETKLTISYATSRFKFGTLISCEPSRFLDEIDAKYLELDYSAKPASSGSSAFFDDDRKAWSSGKQADAFSKPKPATTAPVKTTSILAKAHVPSPNFKPSDTSNLQVGMEVEHERFGFGKVLTLEGNKPDVKATIFFKEIGQKQLLLKFAKLYIVNNIN